MKKTILVLAFLLPLGCQSLRKLTDGPTSTPPAPTPAKIVISGSTVVDYQGFAPFRTLKSTITVRVKRAGEDWTTCNNFEFKTVTTGTGGVFLGNKEYPSYDGNGNLISLTITHEPVAPEGTAYEITSTLITS